MDDIFVEALYANHDKATQNEQIVTATDDQFIGRKLAIEDNNLFPQNEFLSHSYNVSSELFIEEAVKFSEVLETSKKEESNQEKDVLTEVMDITDPSKIKKDIASSAIHPMTQIKAEIRRNAQSNHHFYGNRDMDILAKSSLGSFDKPANILTEEQNKPEIKNIQSVSRRENPANWKEEYNQYLKTNAHLFSYPRKQMVKESECQSPIIVGSREEISMLNLHTKLRPEAVDHQISNASKKKKMHLVDELWEHYKNYHSEDLAAFKSANMESSDSNGVDMEMEGITNVEDSEDKERDMNKKSGLKVQLNQQGDSSTHLALGISNAPHGASDNLAEDLSKNANLSSSGYQLSSTPKKQTAVLNDQFTENGLVNEDESLLLTAVKNTNGDNKEMKTLTEEIETELNNVTDQSISKNDNSSAVPSITLVKELHLADLKKNWYNNLYSNAALDIVAKSNSFEKSSQVITDDQNTMEVKHSQCDSSKESPVDSNFDSQNEANSTEVKNMSVKGNDSSKENLAKPTFNQYFNQYLKTLNFTYQNRRVVKSAEAECQFPILAKSKKELSKQLTHKNKLRSEAINHQIVTGQKKKNDVIDELWNHYMKYHSEDLTTFESVTMDSSDNNQ